MDELTSGGSPRRRPWLPIGLAAVGVVLAYLLRFIQDDAFISFRYAANLASGKGLVFNPGEHVEGYTNFLWTLLMAGPQYLGLDAIRCAQAAGLICFLGSLAMSHRLARIVSRRDSDALLVLVLLVTSFSFLSYATGGLETQLQTFLLVAFASSGLADRPLTERRAISLSLVCGLALLTRLDSILVIAPIAAFVFHRNVWSASGTTAAKIGRSLTLITPVATIMAVWFAWKLAYYGTVLPNTAAVKGASASAIGLGVRYVALFVRQYWMAPVLVFAALQWGVIFKDLKTRALAACLALWLTYLVVVGGDFMEFRLLVPVLPLLFVVVVAALPKDATLKAACVATLILGSVAHATTFRGVGGVESVRGLHAHVSSGDEGWRQVGRSLGALFASTSPPPVIATTAVGAIPYYSMLPTVDMLGLTDPEVARHGIVVGPRPGHRKLATTGYLAAKKVNFVLGHPHVENRTGDACETIRIAQLKFYGLRDVTRETLPKDAAVVDFPIGGERVLRVVYFTRTPELDDVVARFAVRNCPIESDAP